MIVYPLILIFSFLLIYQICFQPLQEGITMGAISGKMKGGVDKAKNKARNEKIKQQRAKKGGKGPGGPVRSASQFPENNDGMSNMGDRVLKNHDEIVRIKAVLDTNYRPLIENTSGQPTNLLTRLATLESSVEALEMEKLKEQETNMQKFEGIEETQK